MLDHITTPTARHSVTRTKESLLIKLRPQKILALSLLFLLPLLAGCGDTQNSLDDNKSGETDKITAFEVTAEDYAAATALLEGNAVNLVKNLSVVPHWLGDSSRFWYKRDGILGTEYVVVDSTNGEKIPAFDQVALAGALSKALDQEITANALGLSGETINASLSELTAVADTKEINCNLVSMSCQAFDSTPTPQDVLASSTGAYLLKAAQHNLVLVEKTTGSERQLTVDGEPYMSWGKLPDSGLIVIQIKKHGLKMPPVGAQFSPDDRYLVASLNDERKVETVPFVEWVPTDGSLRPIVHEVRHPYTGDQETSESSLWVFDLESGGRKEIKFPDGYFFGGIDSNVIGWSVDRGQAFVIARTFGSQKAALFLTDLDSGQTSMLIEETSGTRAQTNSVEYNRGNFRIINDGNEVVWYSDRTGWGHLYLYDAQTGVLKNSITTGDWLVQDIHALDLDRREIYFTGGGRESGRDPYYRHLYRASLDGGEVTLLTPPNADHEFAPDPTELFRLLMRASDPAAIIRPDLGVFIDTWSTVDSAPITALRSTRDGSLITTLETADASALFSAGWQAPVRQTVKAADGETDIYTVYFPPAKQMPGQKHPVIDAVYGGPQVIVAPRNFKDAAFGPNPTGQQALTRLGFAVVTTDGRGTPLRDNAFRDAGYTEFTQVAIDDHVEAIKQLAVKYPQIDTERVGIYGWSWGGTFTAQAMLSRPEFYDVGMTGAGVYDYAALYPGFESFTGIPEYSDGSSIRTEPSEKPVNWDKLDITAMAPNLQGKMLIIYGDMDENVPQSQAFRLIDALVRANKPYDLLYLPNATHGVFREGYTLQRTFDYFVEHLMDAEPPAGVTVEHGSSVQLSPN